MLADKTIKLWKVFEKSLRVVAESNMGDGQRGLPTPSLGQHLRLPRMQHQDNIIAAVPRKVYSNAHAYHIHSITVNSDQETYISADDLRINLWNLNISDQSFSASFFVSVLFLCSIFLLLQTLWISNQLTWRSSLKS
jgi:serine/threonine-protein phosphatase 2A regulatory subunit B